MSATTSKTEPRYRQNSLKMSKPFKEWLDRFAADQRSDVAHLLEQGLAQLARARGFEPPPAR